MKNAKVSVIVPVYNVEEYLPKCLESLVNQTLPEIEILVVNDGSPDNSQAIIDDYAARYPDKIRAFIKENGGLSDARNYGLAHATGEYIAFVDSDDYVDIDMYELMYKKAAESDSDVVCCPYTDVYERRVGRNYFGGSMKHFGKSVAESPKILRYANSFAWNKIYRREFWNQHNFLFPVGQWFEDSALIYNVMGAANRVECVNIPFYYYLKSREDSITNTVDERLLDILKSVTSLVEFYKNLPESPEMQHEINYLCLRHTLARIRKLDQIPDKRFAKRFLDECYAFYEANLPGWRETSYVRPPKKARKKTKIRCYIQRNQSLARLWYTNRTLKISCKAVAKFVKNTRKNTKKAWKKLTTSKRDIAKREEAAKRKKRAAIQKNGVAVMCLVQRLLKEVGVLSFADFGTLLGIIREGHLLRHDLDMDIGVIVKDKHDIDRLRLHLEKFGFRLWRQYLFSDTLVEESYHFSGIKVDLNYYVITETESKTWLFYREPDVEYPDNTRNIVEMTYSPITEFKTVKVQGQDVVIPVNAEQILEEKYGPTWRTPDKGWIYWLSPAATKIPEIGYFITHRNRRTTIVNEEWYADRKRFELAKVRGYQLHQIQLMHTITDLCKKHNLRYYLADSTLRFAKYYNKIAPWVTNVYLSMPKKDYDAFIEYAKAELPISLAVQHSSTIPEYWLPHLTIRMKERSPYYHVNLSRIGEYCGPCVYILPLCPVPEETSPEQVAMARRYATLRRRLMVKKRLAKPRDKKELKAAQEMTFEQIHAEINQILSAYDDQPCDYVCCLSSSTNVKRATYPKAWFDEVEYIPFEGTEMPLPSHVHELAEQRFGFGYAHIAWNKRKITKNIRQVDLVDLEDPLK